MKEAGMKVLVIGSGGREHALIEKLAQSKRVKKIFCTPGNGGIEKLAQCVAIMSEDVKSLLEFAQKENIDLTVVGPEAPLSLGIVDEFEKNGLKIFGPRKNAAILEGSKIFTKEFCERHALPTAPCKIFYKASDAKEYIESIRQFPVVIKADGLALGKGVVIAQARVEAIAAIEDMMVYEKFGDAGRSVVIEDFLPGEEATYMVITDGTHFVSLESAQDHKRVFDNDEGPNTGGMGAYSPAPVVTPEIEKKVISQIIEPALKGLRDEGRKYTGILYAGLMIRDNNPYLIEFNCRFGDPEAQAILSRLSSDLMELIESVVEGDVRKASFKVTPQSSICIVMASEGYPGPYPKGKLIRGIDKAEKLKDVTVYHAGTRLEGSDFYTTGGRVLGVTALGRDLKSAIRQAYKAVEKISWEGAHYRKDIGQKGLKHEG